jgi:hypothetical protein
MDQLTLYEPPAPDRYRELRDRPWNWVVPDSELMEELLKADLIARVLEFAARRVCPGCAEGRARLQLDPETPSSYVHDLGDDYGAMECRAASFIDGPAAGEEW